MGKSLIFYVALIAILFTCKQKDNNGLSANIKVMKDTVARLSVVTDTLAVDTSFYNKLKEHTKSPIYDTGKVILDIYVLNPAKNTKIFYDRIKSDSVIVFEHNKRFRIYSKAGNEFVLPPDSRVSELVNGYLIVKRVFTCKSDDNCGCPELGYSEFTYRYSLGDNVLNKIDSACCDGSGDGAPEWSILIGNKGDYQDLITDVEAVDFNNRYYLNVQDLNYRYSGFNNDKAKPRVLLFDYIDNDTISNKIDFTDIVLAKCCVSKTFLCKNKMIFFSQARSFSGGNYLETFDMKGKPLWKTVTDYLADFCVDEKENVLLGTGYYFTDRATNAKTNNVIAVNLLSGEILWETPLFKALEVENEVEFNSPEKVFKVKDQLYGLVFKQYYLSRKSNPSGRDYSYGILLFDENGTVKMIKRSILLRKHHDAQNELPVKVKSISDKHFRLLITNTIIHCYLK